LWSFVEWLRSWYSRFKSVIDLCCTLNVLNSTFDRTRVKKTVKEINTKYKHIL